MRHEKDFCYWAIISSYTVISLNSNTKIGIGRDGQLIRQPVGNLEQKHMRNSAALLGGT